jgi:aminomethyltransferase
MPDKTALYDRHVALGARIIDFHGWLLPVQYEGILAEHRRCRTAAAVFDTGHMGQFAVTGPEAAARLAGVLTQDTAGLPVGRCRYGFMLNEDGGIIDDTVVMRLAPDELLLVVNAGPLKGDFQWLSLKLAGQSGHRDCYGIEGKVLVEDLSRRRSKLDLQGPASLEVLQPLVDADLKALGYFHAARAACCGRPIVLSRTGYTGELGYELFVEQADAGTIFEALLANPLVGPAGLGARDLLRLEMCYPLHGQDISPGTNPLEADLGQFVDPRREFIGSGAVARVAASGASRRLVGFRGESRRRAETRQAIRLAGRGVGAVTSGGFSPSLRCSIGLGYVAAEHSAVGTKLTVAGDRGEIPVEIAAKPLYKNGTCRKKL